MITYQVFGLLLLIILKKVIMIFFIRFVTAACLYAYIGKANIWLNPTSNLLLVFSSRFCLVLAPLFSKTMGRFAISLSIMISVIGSILFCFNKDSLILLGALFVGIGISVVGYLIRSTAAETIIGAAYNKIALNLGSLFSGIILLFSINSKNVFFVVGALILLLTSLISFVSSRKEKKISLPIPKSVSKKKYLGWSLIGIAIGIKIYSIFSVLPQYILFHTNTLPNWYGLLVMTNSIIIILFQLPIIHWIKKFQKNNNSFKITLSVMFLGMILIGFPQLFHISFFLGALIWVILLSMVECVISYLDVVGAKQGCLFIKELSVGLGGGICVLFTRFLPFHMSNMALGFFGIIAIIIAIILLYDDLKQYMCK